MRSSRAASATARAAMVNSTGPSAQTNSGIRVVGHTRTKGLVRPAPAAADQHGNHAVCGPAP